MHLDALYAKIQLQQDQQLPFVLYRKASETVLQGILQDNNKLYELDSYQDDSGFVMAPFDTTHRTVLIPFNKSTFYKSEIKEERITSIKNSTKEIRVDSKTKQQHIELVQKGIEYIKSNESIKKVVLSRSEEILKRKKESLSIFKELIINYPTAFVYCWYHPAIGMWLGATPETLVTIDANTFSTMALAGTQLYRDTKLVQWGEKEKEEHGLVQSFIEDELANLTDNITSSQVYTHKAGTLLHLRVDIKGVLDISHGINDIITALHPTPAVCGLPKEDAKSFILETEGYNRKYYTGFLGELNISKDEVKVSDLYVNLRCMELQNQKAIVYVGGGITQESDPEKEWEETVRKTETMKKVLY